MDFKDVQVGQQAELEADRHNAVNALLRLSAGASFDRGLVAQSARTARSPDLSVKNVSGGSLDQYAVVEITGTAIAADTQGFRTSPVLEVDTPGEGAVALAVLAEPVADTKTGSAWIHGHVTLQIDVTDEDHKYVDAKDGSTQFESGDGGYVIQWKESGTGIKWAVVNLSRQSGGSLVGVEFEAPTGGIGDGQTVTCTALSFSDGRNATNVDVEVENTSGSVVCDTGSRQGLAYTWDDHYKVHTEYRECEEEEAEF